MKPVDPRQVVYGAKSTFASSSGPNVPFAPNRKRRATVCVLVAAAVPGLLFAPVFGWGALLLPLGVLVAVLFAVAELCVRIPRLVPWRPVLMIFVGLLAITLTLLRDTIPTGTWHALTAGALDSWQLTLQSTWPARPEPELMLFVPLAVLVAAVIGVELLRVPLLALVPGLALLVLSQSYEALRGPVAIVAALGFVVVAAVLLSKSGRSVLVAIIPIAVTATAAAVLVGVADPVGRPAYSLRSGEAVSLPSARIVNPLDEVADRLRRPDVPVFTYTSAERVDRWREVVLDSFDGVTWRTTGVPRRMGTELAPPRGVSVGDLKSAQVRAAGPWLPSQALPAGVIGVPTLVDEASGVLRLPTAATTEYTLSWWEPAVGEKLIDAAVDHAATGKVTSVGRVPDEVRTLATTAVNGTRPSMRAAFALERFLSEHYRLAKAPDLPTGSGWPQLRTFLLDTKTGTNEQFAAAYVAMAATLGIPARLVVGYRSPDGAGDHVVVRGGNAHVWPEVAVEGAGWVPLDPSGAAATGTVGLEAAKAKAREKLEPREKLQDPSLPAQEANTGVAAGGRSFPFSRMALFGFAGVLITWLAGVPLLTMIRGWRRRRRTGRAAIVGAWSEARDRLRAHGFAVTPGMTVRDVAELPELHTFVHSGLNRLADSVDAALWSKNGEVSAAEAWTAVGLVRKGLARAPWRVRMRAAVDPGVLGRRVT